jgi:hypothetical protein
VISFASFLGNLINERTIREQKDDTDTANTETAGFKELLPLYISSSSFSFNLSLIRCAMLQRQQQQPLLIQQDRVEWN